MSSSISNTTFQPYQTSHSDEKREFDDKPTNYFNKYQKLNLLSNFAIKLLDEFSLPLNGDTPQKNKTKEFFLDIDNLPINKIVKPLVNFFDPSDLKEETPFYNFLTIYLKLLYNQQFANIEYYVSHDINHSLHVADYIKQIVKSGIEVKDMPLSLFIGHEYNLNEDQVNLILTLLGILHDCGYAKLIEIEQLRKKNQPLDKQIKEKKPMHAVHGADEIDQLKEPLFKLLYGPNDFKTSPLFDKLFDAFRNAIFFHCADSIDGHFDGLIKVNNNEYIFKHSEVTQVVQKFNLSNPSLRDSTKDFHYEQHKVSNEGRWLVENFYGLRFYQVNIVKDPLNLLIRLADNMDTSRARFSELQSQAVFQQIYHDMGHKVHINHSEVIAKFKDSLKNNIKFGEEIKKLVEHLDGASVDHFGGCECIDSVRFSLQPIQPDCIQLEKGILGRNSAKESEVIERNNLTDFNEEPELTINTQNIPYVTFFIKSQNYHKMKHLINPEGIQTAAFQIWRSVQAFQSLILSSEKEANMQTIGMIKHKVIFI